MTPPAMVFAAGFGTRMGALTRTLPKPLLRLGGRALIDHALDLAAAAGIARAVVNLHYRGEMIRAHLAGRRLPEILFSEEAPGILETGGGLKAALPLLGPGPVLTLNSDAVWPAANPLPALLGAWAAVEAEADALLLLVPRREAIGHAGPGDFFPGGPGAEGRPRRRGTAPEAPLVYAGASIIRGEAVAAHPGRVFSLNAVWDGLLARDRLRALVHPGPWADIGTAGGLARAAARLDGAEP